MIRFRLNGVEVAVTSDPAARLSEVLLSLIHIFTSVIAGSVKMRPLIILRKSTNPESRNIFPIATPSSASMPPASTSSAV